MAAQFVADSGDLHSLAERMSYIRTYKKIGCFVTCSNKEYAFGGMWGKGYFKDFGATGVGSSSAGKTVIKLKEDYNDKISKVEFGDVALRLFVPAHHVPKRQHPHTLNQ